MLPHEFLLFGKHCSCFGTRVSSLCAPGSWRRVRSVAAIGMRVLAVQRRVPSARVQLRREECSFLPVRFNSRTPRLSSCRTLVRSCETGWRLSGRRRVPEVRVSAASGGIRVLAVRERAELHECQFLPYIFRCFYMDVSSVAMDSVLPARTPVLASALQLLRCDVRVVRTGLVAAARVLAPWMPIRVDAGRGRALASALQFAPRAPGARRASLSAFRVRWGSRGAVPFEVRGPSWTPLRHSLGRTALHPRGEWFPEPEGPSIGAGRPRGLEDRAAVAPNR